MCQVVWFSNNYAIVNRQNMTDMKKILLYAVLLFAAIGCVEAPMEEGITSQPREMVSLTIRAEIPTADDTRVSVTPSGNDLWRSAWEYDDVLTLVPAAEGTESVASINPDEVYKLSTISIEDGVATFSGDVAEGTYDVYCVENYTLDSTLRVDYSKQKVSKDIYKKVPIKAAGTVTVAADTNGDYTSPVLYFENMAQIAEIVVSVPGEDINSDSYSFSSLEISGTNSNNSAIKELGKIAIGLDDLEFSASELSHTIYCYLPAFTVEDGASLLINAMLDKDLYRYKASKSIQNTSGGDVNFYAGTHNKIVAKCGGFHNGQWGETLKGDGEVLKAYPDFFVNYWAYAYQTDSLAKGNVLCIRGEYPNARYFSFSVYNDETGDVLGGIDDVDIDADQGSVNPFKVSSDEANRFTLYVVPSTMSNDAIESLPSTNICRVPGGVAKVALCIREYLGVNAEGEKDEFGGVELPSITAVDIKTLDEMRAPDYIESNVDKLSGYIATLKSDEFKEMPFYLSPVSKYYPNNSTDYLYARTHLQQDSVLTMTFIPVDYPKQVADYAGVNARYWSVCLGSAVDTRSYYSIADYQANYVDGEKASFAVVLKSNSKLEEIKAKVEELNADGEYWNLIVWDSEKLNIDNKAIGEYIVFMYRNILPNKEWEHSIANMKPTAYYDYVTEPYQNVEDPTTQIANIALGKYGPLGIKESTAEFLDRIAFKDDNPTVTLPDFENEVGAW